MPRVSSHFSLQDPRFQSLVMPMILPLTLTAAATLTSPQLLQGFLIVNAAAGVNITLPSASDLCNNVQGCARWEHRLKSKYEASKPALRPSSRGAGVTLNSAAAVAAAQ